MASIFVNVKRLRPGLILPQRAFDEDAGSDLFAPEDCVLMGHKTTKVPLGFAAEFSSNFWAQLLDRSGMASRSFHVLAGVIEPGYRGEWSVVLHNFGCGDYVVRAGDRICQVVFKERHRPVYIEVEELGQSLRGERGFGSTGA